MRQINGNKSLLVGIGVALALAFFATGCGKGAEPAAPGPANAPAPLTGPLRNAAYLDVTAEYGALVLSALEVAQGLDTAGCQEGGEGGCGLYQQALHADGTEWKAWSAWWLPLWDDYLFRGGASPLRKYDEYVRKLTGSAPGAADREMGDPLLYNPNREDSEGRCNAWALASLLEPEPGPKGSGPFGIGDLKALLLKSYENVKAGSGIKVFGKSYANDERESDDIYPDQFHRFVQAELFGKKKPFIMDRDKGRDVWNAPMWAARILLSRKDGEPNVLHADMYLEGANLLKRRELRDSFAGYLPGNVHVEYELRGEWQEDGSFRVSDGVWVGHSKDVEHPDFVVRLPEGPVEHWSDNPKIDTRIVSSLAAASRR